VPRNEFINCKKQSTSVAAMSTAASLLGLRFRFSPGAWVSVSYKRRVLSGSGLCEGWSLVQRTSDLSVIVKHRNDGPIGALAPWTQKIYKNFNKGSANVVE